MLQATSLAHSVNPSPIIIDRKGSDLLAGGQLAAIDIKYPITYQGWERCCDIALQGKVCINYILYRQGHRFVFNVDGRYYWPKVHRAEGQPPAFIPDLSHPFSELNQLGEIRLDDSIPSGDNEGYQYHDFPDYVPTSERYG